MAKTIYLSEQGDDKNDGLTDETPVRTAAKAVKTSIKFGAQGVCVLGSGAMLERLKRRTGGGTQKGDETLMTPSMEGRRLTKPRLGQCRVSVDVRFWHQADESATPL